MIKPDGTSIDVARNKKERIIDKPVMGFHYTVMKQHHLDLTADFII